MVENGNRLLSLDDASTRAALGVLGLLLVTDLGYALLHFFHDGGFLRNARLLITREIGHAEIYQNIKEFWCVMILAALAIRTRSPVMAVWLGIFLLLFVLDSLQWHDLAGRWLVGAFDLPALFGLVPRKIGQLGVLACVSIIALGFLAVYYWRSPAELRRFSRRLIVYLFILSIVAVVFDALFTTQGDGDSLISYAGELAELVLLSVIVCYLFAYWLSGIGRGRRQASA